MSSNLSDQVIAPLEAHPLRRAFSSLRTQVIDGQASCERLIKFLKDKATLEDSFAKGIQSKLVYSDLGAGEIDEFATSLEHIKSDMRNKSEQHANLAMLIRDDVLEPLEKWKARSSGLSNTLSESKRVTKELRQAGEKCRKQYQKYLSARQKASEAAANAHTVLPDAWVPPPHTAKWGTSPVDETGGQTSVCDDEQNRTATRGRSVSGAKLVDLSHIRANAAGLNSRRSDSDNRPLSSAGSIVSSLKGMLSTPQDRVSQLRRNAEGAIASMKQSAASCDAAWLEYDNTVATFETTLHSAMAAMQRAEAARQHEVATACRRFIIHESSLLANLQYDVQTLAGTLEGMEETARQAGERMRRRMSAAAAATGGRLYGESTDGIYRTSLANMLSKQGPWKPAVGSQELFPYKLPPDTSKLDSVQSNTSADDTETVTNKTSPDNENVETFTNNLVSGAIEALAGVLFHDTSNDTLDEKVFADGKDCHTLFESINVTQADIQQRVQEIQSNLTEVSCSGNVKHALRVLPMAPEDAGGVFLKQLHYELNPDNQSRNEKQPAMADSDSQSVNQHKSDVVPLVRHVRKMIRSNSDGANRVVAALDVRRGSGRLWLDLASFNCLVSVILTALDAADNTGNFKAVRSLMVISQTFYTLPHPLEEDWCMQSLNNADDAQKQLDMPHSEVSQRIYLSERVKSHKIWKDSRFWEAALFDSLGCEMSKAALYQERDELLAQAEANGFKFQSDWTPEQDDGCAAYYSSPTSHTPSSVASSTAATQSTSNTREIGVGQLCFYGFNMVKFGVAPIAIRTLLDKYASFVKLTETQVAHIHSELNSYIEERKNNQT